MTAAQQTNLFDPARLAAREAVLQTAPSPEQRARRNKLRPCERDWKRDAEQFMSAHPEALTLFCYQAMMFVGAHPERRYLSAKHVWEECRVQMPGLNWSNNFTAYFAVAAKARHPILATRFRERRSA